MLLAKGAGAAVLPGDGAMDGLAGGAVPPHCGFALVGDAGGGDIARPQARLLQHVACAQATVSSQMRVHRAPPSPTREVLRQFALRHRQALAARIEQDGPGAGRALIDGEQRSHGLTSNSRLRRRCPQLAHHLPRIRAIEENAADALADRQVEPMLRGHRRSTRAAW